MAKGKDYLKGGAYAPRDTDWRTYEVMTANQELPATGGKFRSWPFGDHFHYAEGLSKVIITLAEINNLIDNGVIRIVAPARLAAK